MPRKTKPRRTLKLRLDPYPARLCLNLDQSVFKEEDWKDAIGLASRNGTQLEMCINLENSKQTQLEAVIHESAHIVQLLQETVTTTFDKETAAYWTQRIAIWAISKIGLELK